VPDRFTPRNSTGRPCPLTSLFPDTCNRGAVSRWWGPACPVLPGEQAGVAQATAASRHSSAPRRARRGPARFCPMRER